MPKTILNEILFDCGQIIRIVGGFRPLIFLSSIFFSKQWYPKAVI